MHDEATGIFIGTDDLATVAVAQSLKNTSKMFHARGRAGSG
jgi:hypothetical protein